MNIEAIMIEFNCEKSTAQAAIALFGSEAVDRMRARSYEDFCAIARKKREFAVQIEEPEFILVD